MTDTPLYEDAVYIQVRDIFVNGDVDQVILAYQEFVSMGTQRVAVRRFLPLESMETVASEGSGDSEAHALFEFEPSPEGVLSSLLPRYVESRLYSALLDRLQSMRIDKEQ